MEYNIVSGEELRKIMWWLENPIPFNEDLSQGTWSSLPFSAEFILERSSFHKVSEVEYRDKLALFFDFLHKVERQDNVHLYYGEDNVCLANRSFLIEFLKPKAGKLTLHIVNEYTGEEITNPIEIINKRLK